MYHCLSVCRSIFMILSSSGISLNRHQCAVSVYMRYDVYNLYCRNMYSRISEILHRSFSSLCLFQRVLSSYPLYLPFLIFLLSGCSHSAVTPIFLLAIMLMQTLVSISLFRLSLPLYCRSSFVYLPCLTSYDFSS